MSDIHNTAAPVATEPTTATATAAPELTENKPTDAVAPVEPAQQPLVNGETAKEETAAPVPDETKGEVAPVAAAETKAEKAVEPISEGVLSWKGPGLLKSLIASKKEFWLSDSPVTPQHLDLYMRGEKPEISNAVVAWASQTGKGLLFFNKKDEKNTSHPQNVLPLYDATELQKASPHEITFMLHGHKHTLKAANDTERDGWFMSLERAVEIGKADKETVRASEGYKAEMEKLNKPNTFGTTAAAGAASTVRSPSKPSKAVETDGTDDVKRTGSSDEEKKVKSRSTSRGILNRLQGKKEESEIKKEEKKEQKEEKKEEKRELKEEKKEQKEEAKLEKEAEKHGEHAPAAAAVVPGAGALDAPGTAERVFGAPVEEPSTEAATSDTAPKADGKPKMGKRDSIFGRAMSAFSPSREKSMKEAELKPEVPPKDAGVSETAPQIPEPQTEPAVGDVVPPTTETAAAEPTVEHGKPAEAAKEQLDAISPTQKKSFLSGLPFLNKRDRSVSPSAAMKDAPATKTEETPALLAKEEPVAAEPAAVEEPIDPVTETAEKPVEKFDEPKVDSDATSPANKRQSVFTNLSRRASKAFGKGLGPTRKENAVPATTETKAEDAATTEAKPLEDKPLTNGTSEPAATEDQKTISDVVPDAVNIGQAQTTSTHTPTVTASA